ncbi:MAG TPA: addiction module protein [Pyrinomonadaceae bacterium]|nr:addiction module protein [Pyrinomonadaceae bacterium]
MSKAFEELAKEATQLSRQQRVELASILLAMNEDPSDTEVSAAWEREILARIRAVDENQIEGVSFETIMREAEDRFTSSESSLSTRPVLNSSTASHITKAAVRTRSLIQS